MKALVAAVILAVGLWMAANTYSASNERIQASKAASQAAQIQAEKNAAAAKLWQPSK